MNLGHVALDGTKVRDNASKYKAMSYKPMKEKEAQLLGEVDELLRRAQEVHEEDDRGYGNDRRGDESPAELAFREGRLENTKEELAVLEAEAKAEAERAAEEGKKHPGAPDDQAQRNFTDPESRIIPGSWRTRLPAGSSPQADQAVVDHDHRVIVAAKATNQASNERQPVVMVEETIANTGVAPGELSADAGYYAAQAVANCTPQAPTRSSRRNRPATGTNRRMRPGDASPKICLPGTGCAASCSPNGVASVTRRAWRRWSRYSARSSRAEGSGSSRCGG